MKHQRWSHPRGANWLGLLVVALAGTSLLVWPDLSHAENVADRYEVTDDGPGIPAELLPNLFQRFTRGDSSRNRVGGSTGLGLAIAHAVVQAHHGTIAAASSPGHTLFTVRLPAA